MKELIFTQIEKRNEKHYSDILPLWVDYICELYEHNGKSESKEAIIKNLERRINIQGSRPSMHFDILYFNNQAIGFSNFAVDLGTVYGLLDVGFGTVMEFYIVPDFRRRGLGKLMFEHIQETLLKHGVKHMYICPDLITGVQFWKAMGFVDSGKIDPDVMLPIYIKNLVATDTLSTPILQITEAKKKSIICNHILKALPDWFGVPESIQDYTLKVADMPFFACYFDGVVIGFVAIKVHNTYTAEVCVMGVLKEYHRQGIGKRLIELCVNYCKEHNHSYLTVKTLADLHADEGYAKTIKFYLSCGFRPLEVFTQIWDENNPCLFMAMKITQTDFHG